jgi:hypothetical protein
MNPQLEMIPMRTIRPIIVIFLLIAIPVAAQEKIGFRLNPDPGATYSLTMVMNQKVTQAVDDEEQTLAKNMSLVWEYEVLKKKKSGQTEVKLTYKRVKMSQDYGPQNVEYDSDNPPAFLDPSMKSLASLPGAELNVVFAPDGQVEQIRGVDELLDRMVKSMELPENPHKNEIISDLKRQFGAEALKQTLGEITSFYPEKPVAVGEQWDKELSITTGFPMNISSEYTLGAVSGDTATIQATARVESGPDSGAVTMGELIMKYNIQGEQDGTITVSTVTGLPIRTETNLHFDGAVTVSGIDDEGPRTWPISSAGTVIVTFVRLE